MKIKTIFLSLLIFGSTMPAAHNQAIILKNLEQICLEQSDKHNPRQAQTIRQGFATLHRLKNSNTQTMLGYDSISKIFDTQNATSLQPAQNIILVVLHAKMLQESINSSLNLLNKIEQSLHFWQTEQSNHDAPTFQKNPSYWFSSQEYRHKVVTHLQQLNTLKQDLTTLLGTCLFAQQHLNKLEMDHNLITLLQEIQTPLLKFFCFPDLPTFSTQICYQNLSSLLTYLHQHETKIQAKLYQHQRPNHFAEHKIAYTTAAVAALTGLCWYATHKQQIKTNFTHAKEAVSNGARNHIVTPLKNLKATLWESKRTEFQPLKNPKKIKPFTNWPYLSSLTATINKLFGYVDESTENIVEFINENSQAIHKDFVQTQQLNVQIAAIAPILLASTAATILAYKSYKKYRSGTAYQQIIREQLHAIDCVLNKKTFQPTTQRSLSDDGLLYFLITNFNNYAWYLPKSDRALWQKDVADLLSYDLNYQQKYHVVHRMYHTYEILK